MLDAPRGTRIMKQNGFTLKEFGCGDHPESIYYIFGKDGETISMNYLNPRKGHREAIDWFTETIDDITRA